MSSFHDLAWEDYIFWAQTDRSILKRINALIRDVQKEPFSGKGKPEPLKHALACAAGAVDQSPKDKKKSRCPMDFIQYDQPVQMVGEVELGFHKLGPVLFGFEIEVQGPTRATAGNASSRSSNWGVRKRSIMFAIMEY